MKKFYKAVDVSKDADKYLVRLDEKVIKTPLKKTLELTSEALANAVADEWCAQGDTIEPETMPITQLANTMIDKVSGADKEAMVEQVLNYASSDLVCYFATQPEKLVSLHEQYWSPLVSWLNDEYGIKLNVVSGIQHIEQPEESIKVIEEMLSNMPAEKFTALQATTAIAGSFVIAFAMLEGKLTVEEAHKAAVVDELYQLDTWGEDKEARVLVNNTKDELVNIAKFYKLFTAS